MSASKHRFSSEEQQQLVRELANRHGFGIEAVTHILSAILDGHGSMAQFNHPEFAGLGQWMQGGMIMLSDMSNDVLKGKIRALCEDASASLKRSSGASGIPQSVDVFTALEKLGHLRAQGILTEEEFMAKKTELLRRV